MATHKSITVTNLDLSKPEAPYGLTYGAYVQNAVETISVAAADADGDIYHMLPFSSKVRIKSIAVYNDAITAGTSYDLGLYKKNVDGTYTVIDADVFAAALDLSSAHKTTALSGFLYTLDIINIKKALWQLDPAAYAKESLAPEFYFLSFTANTVGSAQGDISISVDFISPNN